MPDDRSREARSETMRRIKSRGTSCEAALGAELRRRGLRPGASTASARKIAGDPDFFFRRARIAVFVDGCFWHGCPHHCRMPASNRAYWSAKIARNQARDRSVRRALRAQGWAVVRVWEHEVRTNAVLAAKKVVRAMDRRNTISTWTSAPATSRRARPATKPRKPPPRARASPSRR